MSYIIKHKGPNRHERRRESAEARFAGTSAHDLGKRKPRNWHRKHRKAVNASRRTHGDHMGWR